MDPSPITPRGYPARALASSAFLARVRLSPLDEDVRCRFNLSELSGDARGGVPGDGRDELKDPSQNGIVADLGMVERQDVGLPPLGTSLGSGYQLLRFVGAGGMGAVYEALTPSGQRVAVKVLLELPRSAAGAELAARFRREANVTASLDSAHVVPLIDAGVDEAQKIPFLVMPLLAGLDLEQLIQKIGPVHPTIAVRIVRQACKALSAAHEAGIVHRDIKPANLYLDHDARGEAIVRVLDFGIAKWREEDGSLTRTGAMLGTPHYMAPEQTLDARHVDARADVWSLAMSLYESLAGVGPFDGLELFVELHVAINTKDVAHLHDSSPWLDPGLVAVVHGALIRAREDRCPSADEFAAALEPFAYGSDAIEAGMLVPLPVALLESTAPRAVLPKQWRRALPEVAAPALSQTKSDAFLGQSLGGKYELLWRIGQGGMGSVYEAVGDDGNRYAVKVIEPELAGKNPGARRRFVREARAVTGIDCEHVVRVVHADTDPRQQLPFIVMDLLSGGDLEGRIKRLGPLHPVAAARVFIQACKGIQAAHDIGLVHRDIKPANLFLHETVSGELIVKVCDFGIAKQVAADGEDNTTNLTRTGGVMGSPMYMSPEQAKNAKEVDHRTDVWSLGIALYEAVCGTPPWEGRSTVGELILAIYTEPVPHIQDKAPWVPPGLVDVVHRALHRNPGERLPSMREFAAALEPFADGSHKLNAELLKPLDAKCRAARAKRADGHVLTSMGAASVAAAVADAERGRDRRRPMVAMGAVAVLGVGAFALARPGMFSSPAAPIAAQAPALEPAITAQPSAAPIPAKTATVAIEPATATVLVNGAREVLHDGKLTLTGEPGDSFAVVIEADGQKLERTVVLTKDGTANPARLAVALPVKPTVAASPSPAWARPAAPAGTPPPAGPAAPAAVVAPPPAAKAPPPPAKGLGMRDNW